MTKREVEDYIMSLIFSNTQHAVTAENVRNAFAPIIERVWGYLEGKLGDLSQLHLQGADKESVVNAINAVLSKLDHDITLMKQEITQTKKIVDDIEDSLDVHNVDVVETKTADGRGLSDKSDFAFTYPIPVGANLNIPEPSYQFCEVYVNDTIYIRKVNGSTTIGSWGAKTTDTEIVSIKYVAYAGQPLTATVTYQKSVTGLREDIDNLEKRVDNIGTEIETVVEQKLPPTEVVVVTDVNREMVGVSPRTKSVDIKQGGRYTITEDVAGNFINVDVTYADGTSETVCKKINDAYTIPAGTKTAKKNIVAFVYSCYATISITHEATRFKYESDIETVDNKIGNLSKLKTDDKSSMVNATNELVRSLPPMEDVEKWICYNDGCPFDGKTFDVEPPIEVGEKFNIVENDGSYSVYTAINDDDTETIILRVINGSPSAGQHWGEQTATTRIKAIKINSYPNIPQSVSRSVKQLKLGEELNLKAPNRWYGKKWLLVGDSISTEGSAYAVYGYGTLISKSLGLLKTNTAVGGKRLAEMLEQQIKPASKDYHLITIMGGTNDAGYHTGVETARQHVISIIEYIRANYPKTVFMFITPIRRYDVSGGEVSDKRAETKQYVDMIKATCSEYCVPCLDLWDSIAPEIDQQRHEYFIGTHTAQTSDGTHPNALGHELFLAPLIEQKLLEIAPYYFNEF